MTITIVAKMSRSQSPVRCSDVVEATAAADAAQVQTDQLGTYLTKRSCRRSYMGLKPLQVAALEMATLRLEAWRSDESLAAEKIAKWPSNVSHSNLESRSPICSLNSMF